MNEKPDGVVTSGVFDHSPVQGSGTQNITYIQQGPPPPTPAQGMAALRSGRYATAVTALRTLTEDEPDNAEVHLALALALLQGRHPCRCDSRTIEQANAQLRIAQRLGPGLPAPRLALLLLRDAELFRLNAQRRRPTQEDRRLLHLVKPDAAALLLQHIPARESVLWQELAKVADSSAAAAPARRRPRTQSRRRRPS